MSPAAPVTSANEPVSEIWIHVPNEYHGDVLGDINSSPDSLLEDGDPRPAYGLLTGYALDDIWASREPMTTDPGYTFGQNETVDNPESLMFERIDYIFANFGDLVPEKIKFDVLGEEKADMTPSGLWPSDHAGVVADLVCG